MKTLSRAVLGALTLSGLLSAACGGSGASATPGALPGTGGGAGAGGHGKDGGTAGSGNGGSVGNGGAGGSDAGIGAAGADAGQGTAVDTTPPIFGGASKVDTTDGEDRVIVSWAAATDPPNSPDEIAYRVYRATTSGGEDFTRAHRCGDAVPDAGPLDAASVPCFVSTGTGTTSEVVRDAIPAHTFYYVARAVDAAGNEDSNHVEVSATTPDETPPDFGGVRSVAAVTATSIKVAWGAGYDLGTPDSELSFHVFVSATGAPDPSQDTPVYLSKPGERSAVVTGLTPSTPYKVMVRAFDGAAHSDDNTRVIGVATPEGIAPTFDGAKLANAEGTSIRVFWPPATDNVTSTPGIVYDVFQALGTRQEKFNKAPTATSAPGASSILMTGLQPGTRYFYVVRARDLAANEDTNIKEVQATTAVPDTLPPSFLGVQTVVGSSPTSLQIGWSTANDDRTLLASDFTYLIYASTGNPMPLTAPVLTVHGVNTAMLIGLKPATAYNVVVVAEDEAGNDSPGNITNAGTTLAAQVPADTTPPALPKVPTVTPVPTTPTRLNVSWQAATDDTSGATDIRYHVCVSTVLTDCQGASFSQHVVATTNWGATTIPVNFLQTHTEYFVFVRAEDRAGNVESDDHSAQATTATSWSANVRAILVDRCIACHNFDQPSEIVNVGATFLDLTGAACLAHSIPDAGSNGCQLKLVDPTFPQFSYLYRKVNAAGLKTPPFTNDTNEYNGLREPRDTPDPLTVTEDDILLTWIEQGALAN